MASRPSKQTGEGGEGTREVEDFLAALEHPELDAIQALRALILAADASIDEGIKWNAPSFRTPAEYFATFHLRAKSGVQMIFHRGARKREGEPMAIADPPSFLEWLGPDRASIRFADRQDIASRAPELTALVRDWIRYV
jgi:hypothetical protein